MELEGSHNPRPFLNTVVAHLFVPARVQMFCNHLRVKKSKRRNILVSIKTSDKEWRALQCGEVSYPCWRNLFPVSHLIGFHSHSRTLFAASYLRTALRIGKSQLPWMSCELCCGAHKIQWLGQEENHVRRKVNNTRFSCCSTAGVFLNTYLSNLIETHKVI